MKLVRGQLYRVREGKTRPLWEYGPIGPRCPNPLNEILTNVLEGHTVLYLGEKEDFDYLWVMVIYREFVGFMTTLGFEKLEATEFLEPLTEEE